MTGTLRILLKATIVVTPVAMLAGIYDYYVYSNLPQDVDPNTTTLLTDKVGLIVALVQLLLGLVTGVNFLRWIFISNQNLRAFSGQPLAFTPGWSIGWYFVPIANIWKPYQAMKEIWNVSHRGKAPNNTLLRWWWALWLCSVFIGRLASKLMLRADEASDYADSALVYVASDGIDLVLCIVALAMVTRIGAAYATNIVESQQSMEGTARRR